MAKLCKYYKRQKFVSYNDGETWQPLDEYARGALIETDSPDCGAITTYRWYPSGTTCIGYDKWNQAIRQVSYDGENWSNVQPEQYTATTMIEHNSEDCGYVPPANFKFKATYSNSRTYSSECNSSSTLTSVETKSFSAYTRSAMTAAIIGDCVTSIGDNAFNRCSGLTSIAIPNSVTSIGEWAFHYCSGLTSIDIPDSVTTIGNEAFELCTNLASITIPNGVTTIGWQTFALCYGLTSITIPNSVTTISGFAFSCCSGLTSITIPDSVTSIGTEAFYQCFNLTSINIPNNVTSIGDYAFYICSGLTSITINATTPPTLGSYVFNYTNDCPIYVPAASVNAYKSAWSTYADRIQAIS